MNTEKPYILHALSPTKFVSPFDVNMAYDSGFDKVSTYTNVEMDDINDLVQDIVFSRHPNDCKKTGLFIAGEDDEKAIEMMEKAKKAMVPPFEISIFADPAGSFTTAAAMIGCVKKLLKGKFKTDLKDKVLQIVGAKGIVGGACAVIAAQEGAKVGMVIHREGAIEPIEKRIKNYKEKYKVNLNAIMGISDDEKTKMSENADIILCAAKAGKEALLKKHFSSAKNLKIVSDVNAVPPPGVEGLEVNFNGDAIRGTKIYGIGALAVGQIKAQVQHKLLKLMCESGKPVFLDFREAFKIAEQLKK
ncbi:MAG: NAD(P)-dependent methylenetetrahydromethanopterin dehydrogenase [Alphaproteobacteria bacterium MarineAlpha6_Bin2]|nr:MAG: NAD(P)-dependent methylenetetrahydromethanopterin dehydrogenase [Alphaproteobacteria bacterium MarineAlpha6_Bin2]